MAEGLISPFMPIFALSLGATKTLIGLLSTLPSLAGLFSQLLWSIITETVRKRKWLVVLGGIFWAVLWIPVAYISDPVHLVILITLQAILSSISIPAWTALLIKSSPSYKRGRITGVLNTANGIGSFVGTIAGGIILNRFGFFPFLFFMVCFMGLLSRLFFLRFPEPRMPVYSFEKKEALKRIFGWKELKRNKRLLSLIKAIAFLNFSVAIAGPFFSVYIVERLGGSSVDIAIITTLGILTSIAFYRAWGSLIDYIGKKAIMLSCLIPISFVPFIYAVSNSVYWLYLFAIISHMSWSGFNLASFTYFSDVLPKTRAYSLIAFYNVITGLSASIAPFFGGLIADLTSIWTVFMFSTFLRISSMHFFDRLEERMGFKPRGIFKFEFDYFGISYRIGTFISTYSLAIGGLRKDIKLSLKRYVRRFGKR